MQSPDAAPTRLLLCLPALVALTVAFAGHTPTAMVAPRQDTPVIELAGQIGGLVSTIAVDGRYAFVGVGPRVAVLDLADPTGLQPVAWSAILPAPVLDLALIEGRLVAAAGTAGLLVLDRTGVPAAPVLVARLQLTSAVYQVVAAGEHAYVGDGTKLAVVALAGADAPHVAHSVELGARMSDTDSLVLYGTHVVIGFRRFGIGVVDIAAPEQAFVAGWNEDTPCYALATGDGFVAVGGWDKQSDGTEKPSLRFLSLEPRDFLHPVALLAVGDDVPVETMTATGRTVYLRWNQELQVVSVNDLSHPVVQHTVVVPPRGMNSGQGVNFYRPRQIAVAGQHVFLVHNGGFDLAHTQSGVLAWDIGAPSGPQPSLGWLEDLPGDVTLAAGAGDFLVLQEPVQGTLRLFRPRLDGSLERLGAIPLDSGSARIAVDPPWLFCPDILAGAPSLFAYDISDLHQPTLAAQQRLASIPSALYTRQGRAYLTQRVPSELGGEVTDIEVRRPMPNGTLALTGLLSAACTSTAPHMTASGARLLLACRQSGLVVADITDPDRPKRLGTVPTDAWAMAVEGDGPFVYVATRWPTPPEERDLSPAPYYGGLRIIDLRTLTEVGAQRVKLDRGGNTVWDVAVVGHYALVTYDGRSVLAFDVTDPTRPTLAQDLTMPSVVGDLVVADDTVYVTGRGGGLYVLRWRAAPGAKPAGSLFLPFATMRRRVP
jgi:hypothetical protein